MWLSVGSLDFEELLPLCKSSLFVVPFAEDGGGRVGPDPRRDQRVPDLWDPPQWLGLSRFGCQRQRQPLQGKSCRSGHLCQIHHKRRCSLQGNCKAALMSSSSMSIWMDVTSLNPLWSLRLELNPFVLMHFVVWDFARRLLNLGSEFSIFQAPERSLKQGTWGKMTFLFQGNTSAAMRSTSTKQPFFRGSNSPSTWLFFIQISLCWQHMIMDLKAPFSASH